jgi:hypothetical protein
MLGKNRRIVEKNQIKSGFNPNKTGVKICTYEDPEKAAAEPTVARMTTAENFILDLNRQKIVRTRVSNLD